MSDEQQQSTGLLAKFADGYGMTREQAWATLTKTVVPGNAKASNEQVLALLVVAEAHGLNPFTKEIYAFPAKGGGIQPIVSIDGWIKLMNNHPAADGIELIENDDADGDLLSVTCKVYRKDREHPTVVTESYEECKRNTDPWKTKPRRMLRHKATIQGIRYAFGFSGIIDDDEAAHYAERGLIDDGKPHSAKAERMAKLAGDNESDDYAAEMQDVIDADFDDAQQTGDEAETTDTAGGEA